MCYIEINYIKQGKGLFSFEPYLLVLLLSRISLESKLKIFWIPLETHFDKQTKGLILENNFSNLTIHLL